MEIRKLIGLRLKELRKKRGLSQMDVANRAGITDKHLSNIELGKENPKLDTFLKLAAVFNVELWELLNYGHHVPPKQIYKKMLQDLKKAKDEDLRLIQKFVNTIMK